MKPDRDMDPPDQYNRRKKKVVNPFGSIVEGVTNSYRAGMGLPPMSKVCPDCREVYESDLIHECPEESTDTDDSMYNDPRHNQAKDINR